MHKGDTIPGILVVLVGAIFLIATMTTANLTFGSTTSDGVPGAGFFPYLLSSATILLGIGLTAKGISQKGSKSYFDLNEEARQNLKVLLFTVIGLIAFLAFWQLTEMFYVGAFVLVLYLNWIFQRTLKFTIIYGVLFTLFIYLVFNMGFSIQF